MLIRLFLTLVFIVFSILLYNFIFVSDSIVVGNAAGLQMESNNAAFITFTSVSTLFKIIYIVFDAVLFFVLYLIWYPYSAKVFNNVKKEIQ